MEITSYSLSKRDICRGEDKKFLGIEKTFGAVAQISAYVDKNQTIQHVGKLATFFVGKYDGGSNDFLESFCQNVQRCNLSIIYKDNIKEKIWEKFIFFISL